MRPEFREMSLYRLAQVLRAMPGNRTCQKLLDFGTRILKEEEEPKPIISLYRILEHITSNTMITNWSTNTQLALVKLLHDDSQVDLANINVRMRVMILNRLSEISKFGNQFIMNDN